MCEAKNTLVEQRNELHHSLQIFYFMNYIIKIKIYFMSKTIKREQKASCKSMDCIHDKERNSISSITINLH